jgi:ABC-type molybdenum transport system ATPase subunit/photorepair protein PhrA
MSRTEIPWMWIIGGPNGAGKTTLAKAILGEVLDTAIFLRWPGNSRILMPAMFWRAGC